MELFVLAGVCIEFAHLARCYYDDQIEKGEMDGGCTAHDKGKRSPEGKRSRNDLGVDGRIMLKSILRKEHRGCGLDSSHTG
jgi:hypothetical protein